MIKFIELNEIVINPFNRDSLGSNSYDVHLGSTLAKYKDSVIDAKVDNPIEYIEIPDEGYVLRPNELYLASTLEYTETMKHIPFLEGKSSTGRLGICIHATAGKGDIGFKGHWTLEVTAAIPVRVYKGMPIGQLIYMEASSQPIVPYDQKKSAKYSSQGNLPVPSQMFKNKF